ncbi:hypothetical protein [Rhodococcus jostii]|uniref:hypothetical protein n=1 Tax=Rhodococcus jostii TaxID=132919 RepID=UPI00362C0E66
MPMTSRTSLVLRVLGIASSTYYDWRARATLPARRRQEDAGLLAPSCDIRLLQASGLVCYLHYRIRRTKVADDRAVVANMTLWGTVNPQA